MGFIGGEIGFRLLKLFAPREEKTLRGADDSLQKPGKIEKIFGAELFRQFSGKTVLDFGCGSGLETVEIARHGALKAIGYDTRNDVMNPGRTLAQSFNIADRCLFTDTPNEKADVIISIDAFEHFSEPAAVLTQMRQLLKEGGYILVSFGPPWYHPFGGHLFSVFPWAHLIFTETALCKWRATYRKDGATRFCDTAGGLNCMTLRRFKKLVHEGGLNLVNFEALPIRKLRFLTNFLTREFFTSSVRCRLE